MSNVGVPVLAVRWGEFSLAEQMGNIGSEVGRAIRAHASGNAARFDGAFARALDLFDLTAGDDRWRGARRREILRAREEFCRLVLDGGTDTERAATERYFLHFAALANAMRTRF
jgi:hypothetical protein